MLPEIWGRGQGSKLLQYSLGKLKKKGFKKILEKCKDFQVSLFVLTHGHMDHCQNAAYLANALHIPIAMNKKDMNLIPDNRKQALLAKTFLGKIVLSVSLSSFEKDSLEVFEPTIYLRNGDGYGKK